MNKVADKQPPCLVPFVLGISTFPNLRWVDAMMARTQPMKRPSFLMRRCARRIYEMAPCGQQSKALEKSVNRSQVSTPRARRLSSKSLTYRVEDWHCLKGRFPPCSRERSPVSSM